MRVRACAHAFACVCVRLCACALHVFGMRAHAHVGLLRAKHLLADRGGSLRELTTVGGKSGLHVFKRPTDCSTKALARKLCDHIRVAINSQPRPAAEREFYKVS